MIYQCCVVASDLFSLQNTAFSYISVLLLSWFFNATWLLGRYTIIKIRQIDQATRLFGDTRLLGSLEYVKTENIFFFKLPIEESVQDRRRYNQRIWLVWYRVQGAFDWSGPTDCIFFDPKQILLELNYTLNRA